jgi:hypothetical protein
MSPTLTFFAGIFCASNELVWLYAKGMVIIPNDPVIMSIIEKTPTVMLYPFILFAIQRSC